MKGYTYSSPPTNNMAGSRTPRTPLPTPLTDTHVHVIRCLLVETILVATMKEWNATMNKQYTKRKLTLKVSLLPKTQLKYIKVKIKNYRVYRTVAPKIELQLNERIFHESTFTAKVK